MVTLEEWKELWKEQELEREKYLAEDQEWERKKKKLLALMDEMNYEQLKEADHDLGVLDFSVFLKEQEEAAKQFKVGDWVNCPHWHMDLDEFDDVRFADCEARFVGIWGCMFVEVMYAPSGRCELCTSTSVKKVKRIRHWNRKLEVLFWVRVRRRKIEEAIRSWKIKRKKEKDAAK
jgi:hypothetical protein